MLFGDRLRKMREDAGMTRVELGNLIGVSDRVLGYYESNDRFPKKPETLQKISEVFHVSVDSLIGQDGAFIQSAGDQYGYTGARQAKDVLQDVQVLFAGGELPEEDRDEFFRLVAEMYFDAKHKNKKYSRLK
ncbi:helix-turn-helix domain-containing protein [Pelotomaculum propionicicum]|uniref:helix-turn-helix domain-containing protein n=1 Tax=Pelotomaculum propionicicum TaxID=258475 RepID=UPI003B7BD8AB